MRITRKTALNLGLLLFMPFLAADVLDAQIIDQIDANIQHSFMIQKKTFPPGKYVFRIDQGSDGGSYGSLDRRRKELRSVQCPGLNSSNETC